MHFAFSLRFPFPEKARVLTLTWKLPALCEMLLLMCSLFDLFGLKYQKFNKSNFFTDISYNVERF
jgi:hypothetical protein